MNRWWSHGGQDPNPFWKNSQLIPFDSAKTERWLNLSPAWISSWSPLLNNNLNKISTWRVQELDLLYPCWQMEHPILGEKMHFRTNCPYDDDGLLSLWELTGCIGGCDGCDGCESTTIEGGQICVIGGWQWDSWCSGRDGDDGAEG